MAQHMEVRNPKAPKILQKIGASIEKEVKKGLSMTSMKWFHAGKLYNKKAEDLEVWQTTRYIGQGIVHGDTRGMFEVHVNGKVAEHIYLVA